MGQDLKDQDSKEVLRMVVEYMRQIMEKTKTIMPSQVETVNKFHEWELEYERRRPSSSFWESAFRDLKSSDAANIVFALSEINLVAAELAVVTSLSEDQRDKMLKRLDSLIETLRKADESLK